MKPKLKTILLNKPINIKLIVAHHQEDLSWLGKLPQRIQPVIVQENREAPGQSYLNYIISNYNELEGWYGFCRGNPFPICSDFIEQLNPSDEGCRIRDIPFHKLFKPLGYSSSLTDMRGFPFATQPMPLLEWAEKLGLSLRNGTFVSYVPGCQFLAHADLLKSKKIEYYESILKLFEEEEASPWIFERLVAILLIGQDAGKIREN